MKSHAKAKRRSSHTRHAAASVRRSPRPQAHRNHVAAKSSTEIALGQEGEGEAQNDQLAALEGTEPDNGADI